MTPLQVLRAHYLNKRIVNDVTPVAGRGNLKGAIIRTIQLDQYEPFLELTFELPNGNMRQTSWLFDWNLEVE